MKMMQEYVIMDTIDVLAAHMQLSQFQLATKIALVHTWVLISNLSFNVVLQAMFLNIYDTINSKAGFIIAQSAKTKDSLIKKMVLVIVENAS